MAGRILRSIRQSPTLAFVRWVLTFLRKDSSTFMSRYPVLAMTPDEAYHSGLERILKKFPGHIPISLKLALAITLLLTVGMLSLGLLVGTNQARLLDKQIALLGFAVAQQVAESARQPLLSGNVLSLQNITDNTLNQEEILGAAIYSNDKIMVATSGTSPPLEPLIGSTAIDTQANVKPFNGQYFNIEQTHSIISFIQPIKNGGTTAGYVLLSFDGSLLGIAKKQTLHMVATITIVMIGFGIMASIILGNRMTRPINELIKVSRAIVDGNYNFQVHERRKDELGMLMESMNTMGQGLLRKEQVEQVFSRYVSENVANQVLRDLEQVEQIQLGGSHVHASVMFADIVGFTSLSETMPPQALSRLLNLYFTYMAKAVRFCQGHIDKYIGDCAMVVFGVPEKHKDHAFNAAACAWMIKLLVQELNRRRISNKEVPIELRIGINSGTMVAGNMGSADRMDYTVVGNTVNLASRLSHVGDPGEIIVSAEMVCSENLIGRIATEALNAISIRGRKHPISIFRVTDIETEFREEILIEVKRIMHLSTPNIA